MTDSEAASERCEEGKDHLRHRRNAEAVSAFGQAIEADNANAESFEGLGTACYLLDRLDDALAAFETAARLAPLSGRAQINMGAIYNRQGDYRKAAQVIRKGLSREKNSSQGYYNLAIAQKGLNQLSMAVSAYKEALRLEPETAEAHLNLGNVYLEMGNNSEALRCFNRALAIRPDFERARRGVTLSEIALEQAKAEFSPFGRLVDENTLRATGLGSHGRELSEQQRAEDRYTVGECAKAARTHAQALLAHVTDVMQDNILAINRVVSESETGDPLEEALEHFRAAVNQTAEHYNALHRQMDELRTHDEQIRRG